MRKKTKDEVLREFNIVHSNRYDYSEVEYINTNTKVKIKCLEHGYFIQIPKTHLKGVGCPECGVIKAHKGLSNHYKKQRNWDFEQPKDYKFIPLTGGNFAKVDNDDFDKVKLINWHYNNFYYAMNKKIGLMHRFIMDCHDDMVVDHINHDTLDNRKSNLRICTRTENNRNQFIQVGKTSKYKGVYWDRSRCKWLSGIVVKRKRIYLGRFTSETDAAKAYDKAAIELFGDFALTNF